jgi:hypothetical protein
MDKLIKETIDDLGSSNDEIRMAALQRILKITDQKVAWVYDVWDSLLDKFSDSNSFQRSIGIMVICNLAKSDSENRLADSLDALLVHTRDEKFITSRQCIQNIWKVAIVNDEFQRKVLDHLEKRFMQCFDEKHYNLFRVDIVQSFKQIAEVSQDSSLLTRARRLIMEETEAKYRKQYEMILK